MLLLLLLREWLRLEPAGAGTETTGVEAHAVRRRPLGTRGVVSLVGDDGARMEVELPIGEHVRPASRVRVLPPDGGALQWVVRGRWSSEPMSVTCATPPR